jgi:hypothetical protein
VRRLFSARPAILHHMRRPPDSIQPGPRLRSAQIIRGIAVALLTAVFIACADGPTGPGTPHPAQIQLEPASATAASLGEIIQFSARVFNQNGAVLSQIPLAWTSSDTTVLVSEGNGRFRARANGTALAMVGLTNDERVPKQTAEVVVRQQAARITSSSDTLTLYAIGQTASIQARVLDALGNDLVGTAAPTWRSANLGVATVDGSGAVTATGDGETVITLQSGQLSKSFITRVSAIVRVAGCVSSADVVGAEKCSSVLLTVRR